ncbi:MAG: hypothetical protein JWL77_1012 [Chthonomonadaceae bacterium]|nr:hypothetical protein [Chthonomonadaceae bacterium]
MEITQNYARPGNATLEPNGMHLDMPAEMARPGVRLEAMVKDSLAYARVMLALYEVVTGDLRAKPKDHTAYQNWVAERYLEELGEEVRERAARTPALTTRRKELAVQVGVLSKQTHDLENIAYGGVFYAQKRKYFDWLYKHDMDAWYVLDPVVSVHPDVVLFEVFSQDESSYGRVTVPTESLDTFGETRYGTTNIDYSRALADEIQRIRSYRPAFLEIGAEGVSVATGAGSAVEKKIDLPPTWVRGFLQVQSASAFGAVDLELSAATLAEVLSVLRRHREKESPRSLRFAIAPGQKPTITIEPWNIVVQEAEHVYSGDYRGEIRLWGRRRLLVIEDLLPHADKVQVRLLGGGMPSYWTIFQKGIRFDLGLSGWTKNDWAQAARFDLLAATADATPEHIERAENVLAEYLTLTPAQLALRMQIAQDAATNVLQKCCARGQAMYDHVTGFYRWRPLLPVPIQLPATDQDKRMAQAKRIVDSKGVTWSGKPSPPSRPDRIRCEASVRQDARGRKEQAVVLEIDADGRVQYAQCDCSFFRRDKLRKGPCPHILAASVIVAEQVAVQAAQQEVKPVAGIVDPTQFAGKIFVFTGALTLFTRDQAEGLVQARGGTASGSVSKNTTYLVAGDKAGSKLAKAQQLGVTVLTEVQFQEMLEGRR